MIIFHSVVPYLLEKCFSYLEKRLLLNQLYILSNHNQAKLFNALPKIKLMLITIHRLHLSIFYIKGIYFTIAKRLANVNYAKYIVNDEHQNNSFSVLGKLSFVQAALMLSLQLFGLYSEFSSTVYFSGTSSAPSSATKTNVEIEQQKCSLCLEQRKHTSLTACGHLFCWSCIQEWIRNKPECPLCREDLHPNQIVCLRNYV